MGKINRNTFLTHSLKAGALVVLTPLSNGLFARAMQGPAGNEKGDTAKDDLLQRLVAANDRQVARLLSVVDAGKTSADRQPGYYFAVLSASYCSPGSEYHQSP